MRLETQEITNITEISTLGSLACLCPLRLVEILFIAKQKFFCELQIIGIIHRSTTLSKDKVYTCLETDARSAPVYRFGSAHRPETGRLVRITNLPTEDPTRIPARPLRSYTIITQIRRDAWL